MSAHTDHVAKCHEELKSAALDALSALEILVHYPLPLTEDRVRRLSLETVSRVRSVIIAGGDVNMAAVARDREEARKKAADGAEERG